MVRNQIANMGSSPPSSSTEATHFGTPSTNITAMSPETCESVPRTGPVPRLNLRVNTGPTRVAPTTASQNAPRFGEPSTAQLSPTAEEFTPRNATFTRQEPSDAAAQGDSPVRNLVASSLPDLRANTQPAIHGVVGQGSAITIVRDLKSRTQLAANVHVAFETFSTDEIVTRTFQIFDQNVPSLHYIINQFPVQFDSLACVDTKHLESGIIRLTFHDDRDAKQAYVLVASLTHPHCELTQLNAKEVALAHGLDSSVVSNYDGQIIVSILYNSQSIMPTIDQLNEKLSAYGSIKAVQTMRPTIMNAITLRVEYNDVRNAIDAVKYLPHASYQDVHFLVCHYEPDIIRHASNVTRAVIQPQTPADRNAVRPSLTGRTTLPSNELARLENVMARVMLETPGSSRSATRSGHNIVDIARIEAGLDVRTTIMLRNIPNRVDQETLKTLLDETSHGEYDFMYLRIDFANNCNVGYAFINFVDPLAIIEFARTRAGQRWNIFSSDKVAEISYATIQGRDCLIQKFRNSSVMLEHPSYCPKLFFTRPSIRAGNEEAFPEPDNYSKMRRSIDNAEHIGLFRPAHGNQRRVSTPANVRAPSTGSPVRSDTSTPLSWPSSTTASSTDTGLFAPREGQAHREEQRRRRSQFDRGTPGAEIELSSYRITDEAVTRAHHARMHTAATRVGVASSLRVHNL